MAIMTIRCTGPKHVLLVETHHVVGETASRQAVKTDADRGAVEGGKVEALLVKGMAGGMEPGSILRNRKMLVSRRRRQRVCIAELLKHLAHLAGSAGHIKRHRSLGAKLAQRRSTNGGCSDQWRQSVRISRARCLVAAVDEAGARGDGQGGQDHW